MRKFIVNEKQNGKKLNIVLQNEYPSLSNSLFYKTLRKKDIRINGVRVNSNNTVYSGDEICIFLTDDFLFGKVNYSIVYEDDNILLINKPSGISVIEENGSYSLTKILQDERKTNHFPYPCHRIDRNTSGLVLFAKNENSLSILFDKFKNKEIEKHYFCVVCGIFKTQHDTLNAYLWKDAKNAKVYVAGNFQKGALPITTSYKVIKENSKEGLSLLDVTLETGRTHQIRAHMAHIGHPLLGDRKIWKLWYE